MSTRSAIIQKTADGYEGIYCHNDGYIGGVGATLLEHYTSAKKVAELIALGDISSLYPRVAPIGPHSFDNKEKGTTVAYHRDRGEKKRRPCRGKTVADVQAKIDHNGYVYVFDNGWTCNGKSIPELLVEELAT